MNAHKFFNFMLAVCFVISLLWVPASVSAQGATYGSINTNLAADSVTGNDWPLGNVVTLTVHDPSLPSSSDIIMTDISHVLSGDSSHFVVEYDLSSKIDLKPGFVLTMTDGTATQTLAIVNLQVTSVDQTADTVSGIAPAGMQVDVNINNAYRTTKVGIDGNWSVDFSKAGPQDNEKIILDILGNAVGWASARNEGDVNSTSTEWIARLPFIQVNIDDSRVWANDWPLDAQLTMTISGPGVNYSAQLPPPERFGCTLCTQSVFLYSTTVHLQAGDVITITDGTLTKSYTVSPLRVTHIDLQANTISGIATPNSRVAVWDGSVAVCCTTRRVIADGSGHWLADFSIPGDRPIDIVDDLNPGSFGQASENNSVGYIDNAGDETWVDWGVPYIAASPWNNWISGEGFLFNTLLTISIDDPDTIQIPDFTTTVNSPEARWVGLSLDYQSSYDFSAGDTITVSDGLNTKSLVVSNVQVTAIDILNDRITGITDLNRKIQVFVNDGNNTMIQAQSDGNGNWSADFTGKTNVQPGSSGSIRVFDDDGDQTHVDWNNPLIVTRPKDDWIRARNWPLGALLTLTIDDPSNGTGNVDYIAEAIAEQGSFVPPQTYADFDMNGFDVKPGQTLTVSGAGIQRILILTDLTVTNVNIEADTISGTSTADLTVNVNACSGDNCFSLSVTPDPLTHTWVVDFNGFLDLVPGSSGNAQQSDANGNITRDSWYIPNLYIEASPTGDWVHARGWDIGTVIAMTINDSSEIYTATMAQAPWNPSDPNEVVADFDLQGYDVKAGDIITATGNGMSKTLTVSQLEVAGFDLENDLISGKGTVGMEIQVCANVPDRCITRWVVPNSLGDWTANYHDPGIGNDDPDTIDIQPNSNGWVAERDQDGDQTRIDWRVPNPSFTVELEENKIYGYDWPDGASVILTIDDPATTQIPDFTDTRIAHVTGQSSVISFDIGCLALRPGLLVNMTDGTTTKTHTILGFDWTAIDFGADIISGIAEPGMDTYVWASGVARGFLPEADGKWTISFAIPGDESWETIVDIQPGMNGGMAQVDSDGDATLIRWTDISMALNQPPVITSITAPISPVSLGQSINATVEFSDPDVGDTHTITWNWGDGTTTTAPASMPSVTTIHTYMFPGVHTISATITDAVGKSATATAQQYVVIYDPNGGFVTGGGWIMSPTGAYISNPTLTGKATFGFVSKYQKGANIPTGNTEFQFHVANMNFKSTSYDWLVIAGKKAQYKGTGTINGSGNYGFMLTAIDDTLDKFRIKIWDKTTGNLIYDNMLDAADSADPVTALGGGSIVIHK